jgi:hypothetical protein
MAQTPVVAVARRAGEQRPAKRPETKEGGREEEEERLGISAAAIGRRLRSAKNGKVTDDTAEHPLRWWSPVVGKKFRHVVIKNPSGGQRRHNGG